MNFYLIKIFDVYFRSSIVYGCIMFLCKSCSYIFIFIGRNIINLIVMFKV